MRTGKTMTLVPEVAINWEPRLQLLHETKKSTILVVDDCLDTRFIVSAILQIHGHKVIKAEDGQSAIELTTKFRPDLILLDLVLPKLSGFQILLRLGEMDYNGKICVYSALEDHEFITKAKDFGAHDYLIKPVTPEQLSDKVNHLLGERH